MFLLTHTFLKYSSLSVFHFECSLISRTVLGFLRSRRDKAKQRKSKKKKDNSDNQSNKEEKSDP